MLSFKRNYFNYNFEQILPFINFKKINWKYFGVSKENELKFKDKFNIFLEKIKKENLIFVKGVYKFYKAYSKENSILVLYKGKEIEFSFPRQSKGEKLCISDFLKSNEPFELICFFILTSGIGIKEKIKKLNKKGEFLFSYFLDVLSIQAAESGAELLEIEVSKKWSVLKKYKGKRFSFGYPPCPDLSYQKILFKILEPEKIGIKLTENFMMEPESSVSGFIINNPNAKYFNVEEK